MGTLPRVSQIKLASHKKPGSRRVQSITHNIYRKLVINVVGYEYCHDHRELVLLDGAALEKEAFTPKLRGEGRGKFL